MARATEGSPRARREAVIQQHVDAENHHDAEGVVASFHRPRYDVVPLGAPHEGPDAVRDLLAGLFQGFPDFHAEPGPLLHADDAVFVEVRMTGTHLPRYSVSSECCRKALPVPALV